jgi:hypothetical protein
MARAATTAMRARNRIRANQALVRAPIPSFAMHPINATSPARVTRRRAPVPIQSRPMARAAMMAMAARNRIRVYLERAQAAIPSCAWRSINATTRAHATMQPACAPILSKSTGPCVTTAMPAPKRTRAMPVRVRAAIPSCVMHRINATTSARVIPPRARVPIPLPPMEPLATMATLAPKPMRVHRVHVPAAIQSSAWLPINATESARVTSPRDCVRIRFYLMEPHAMTTMRAPKPIHAAQVRAPAAMPSCAAHPINATS